MLSKIPKKFILPGVILLAVVLLIGIFASSNNNGDSNPEITPTPKPEPVNVIPIKERPYITLKPMISRNVLEFTIHNLPKKADNVEVTLEYDRNEGVLDAILREFKIEKVPLTHDLFMGSKSAGGHVTYHDDVIGGTLHLEFEGDDPYALEVPWRYDDTLPKYSELSTADGKFQVELDEAFRTKKIVVMQSPGIPVPIKGDILAGPYLFRGENLLPTTQASIKMRLSEENPQATLFGFNGEEWIQIKSQVEGKTISAEADIFDAYIVVEQ